MLKARSIRNLPIKQLPKAQQVFRLGLIIFVLSLLWYLVYPHMKLQNATKSSGTMAPDWIKRAEALENYQQDSSKKEYEYDADRAPIPLLGQ